MTPDPVPGDVRAELERLAGRWTQLPLDQALRHVPAVHALVTDLARRDLEARGEIALGDSDDLATLGEPEPAVVMDQLAAVLYDLFGGPAGEECELGDESSSPRWAAALVDRLTAIRVGCAAVPVTGSVTQPTRQVSPLGPWLQ